MAESEGRRRPKAAYRNTNGFLDHTRMHVQSSVPTPNMHVVAKAPAPVRDSYTLDTREPAMALERRALRDAVEQRRFAEDVLQLKGAYFPGLAAAKEMGERPETSASLKERISELQQRHRATMRTLYTWQADDYLDDALDRYHANDGVALELDAHYQAARRTNAALTRSFDDAVDAHRYAHLKTVLPLMQQRAQLATQEEDTQRKRDAEFPLSIAQYRAIRNKNVQMRVARYLAADLATRERMAQQYGWAFRQTKPLVNDYQHNVVFKRDVDIDARDVEVRDPRRKPFMASMA